MKSKFMVAGAQDAWSLGALGTGVAASAPWFAAEPYTAILAALAATTAGGAGFTWPRVVERKDPVNMDRKQGWVLNSDPVQYLGDPLQEMLVGYTTDYNLPVTISNNKQTYHSATFGASGYGKTVLALTKIYQQTVAPRSGGWIMIDAKLDRKMLATLAYIAKMTGRLDEFYVLNIMDPSMGHTYNPALAGEGHEIASRIMALTPGATEAPTTDYYRQRQNQALTAICSALQACRRNYHFGDLAVLLQSPRALEKLEQITPPNSPERRAYSIFLNQFRKPTKGGGAMIDMKELQTALGGIASRIANFASSGLARSMNTCAPDIDIFDIITQNKMLYVMLPTLRADETARSVAKMLMADIRSAVGRIQEMEDDARPAPPFQLFADEFASYINPESDSRLLEQSRSAGVSVNMFLQSLSQLAQQSEHHVAMLTQNTDSKYFFKHSSADAEDAAELIGMTSAYTHHVATSETSSSSAAQLRVTPEAAEGAAAGITEGYRQSQDEHRVSPDQLRKLPVGECIAIHGANVYHMRTPMLMIPKQIEATIPTLYHRKTDPWMGRTPLQFEDRYRDFLIFDNAGANYSDEGDDAPATAKPADPAPAPAPVKADPVAEAMSAPAAAPVPPKPLGDPKIDALRENLPKPAAKAAPPADKPSEPEKSDATPAPPPPAKDAQGNKPKPKPKGRRNAQGRKTFADDDFVSRL